MFVRNYLSFSIYSATAEHEDEAERNPNEHCEEKTKKSLEIRLDGNGIHDESAKKILILERNKIRYGILTKKDNSSVFV